MLKLNPALSQWMTPAWVARELWAAHFGDAGPSDHVFEPTCGDGRMLQAVPDYVPASGMEIDPRMADLARERTGRSVTTGDVLTAEIPKNITILFGNPPFKADFLDGLLNRVGEVVNDGCRTGLILPAYFMQSPSRVIRWNRAWTICAELLPRTIFARSQLPIIFALFTKDPQPRLTGMRLYHEVQQVADLKPVYRAELVNGTGTWRGVVAIALQELGGRAHVSDIYERVAPRRPTANQWWREKVRQTLQRNFASEGAGVWSHPQSLSVR